MCDYEAARTWMSIVTTPDTQRNTGHFWLEAKGFARKLNLPVFGLSLSVVTAGTPFVGDFREP
jgi:hypothetical protein